MIEVKAEIASLEAAKSGVIWGGVWFELNGEAFPEIKWNDTIVALMVEFIIAIRHIEAMGGKRRIRFFDGPFWIEFERTNSGDTSISTNTDLLASCEPDEFVRVVRQTEAAARGLVVACKEMGWANQDDVRQLDALV